MERKEERDRRRISDARSLWASRAPAGRTGRPPSAGRRCQPAAAPSSRAACRLPVTVTAGLAAASAHPRSLRAGPSGQSGPSGCSAHEAGLENTRPAAVSRASRGARPSPVPSRLPGGGGGGGGEALPLLTNRASPSPSSRARRRELAHRPRTGRASEALSGPHHAPTSRQSCTSAHIISHRPAGWPAGRPAAAACR
jgi:hypothetical protein